MSCTVCEGSGFQFKFIKGCEENDQPYECVFLCKCSMGKWRAAKYQTYTTVDGVLGRVHMHMEVAPPKPLPVIAVPIKSYYEPEQNRLDDTDDEPWL